MRAGLLIPAILALAACQTEPEAPLDLRSVVVEQITDVRFAVSVDAINMDGYELARCVAAAYAFAQVGKDGRQLYTGFVRDGGKITDEFRRVDGERVQRAVGFQTYSFVYAEEFNTGSHDGRDVMAVDRQLAKCESQGLPTTYGEG